MESSEVAEEGVAPELHRMLLAAVWGMLGQLARRTCQHQRTAAVQQIVELVATVLAVEVRPILQPFLCELSVKAAEAEAHVDCLNSSLFPEG